MFYPECFVRGGEDKFFTVLSRGMFRNRLFQHLVSARQGQNSEREHRARVCCLCLCLCLSLVFAFVFVFSP